MRIGIGAVCAGASGLANHGRQLGCVCTPSTVWLLKGNENARHSIPQRPPSPGLQVKDYVARYAKAEDVAALEAEEKHKGPHHEGEAMSEDEEEGERWRGCVM